MDVSAWSQCVAQVAMALSEYDPDHADVYRERSAAYRERLKALDEYAKTTIATIPERQRVLITAHDAFGYFSRAYGIEVRALQGITTESEASVDDVNRLVDFIVERGIKSLFVESSVNQEGIKAILEGAKSRGAAVEICPSELFSDAMGSPGSYEGTYVGMIDHNATTIVRALGGTAPERGLNGKLDAAAAVE
jgi:manganese/zinc/iron transport system substrate-binding protein